MQRMPAVAGKFYPEQDASLRRMVAGFLENESGPETAIGIVSPHAGYMFSGAIAGMTFSRVKVPEKVVVLGPNHQGIGHPGAVFPEGSWLTPLGEIPVDGELAAAILRESPLLAEDALAHRYEHSLEVQVPFIQMLAPEARIVPICLGFGRPEELVAIGEGVGRALAEHPGEVLMVASNDMSHFISGDQARAKDGKALDRVLALDPEGLWRTVQENRISMCGVVPVTVMLAAARRLGARSATLVHYGNSGDVTGDQSQVVGYAGVVVK